MKRYLPRICDAELSARLESIGAILVMGPKWCGKTSTCERLAKSVLKMQDVDRRDYYKSVLDVKPSMLLEGAVPRLIDEWQEAPVLWDAVRMVVDDRQEPGQFLLTGSSTPRDGVTHHTGTGRIGQLHMRPMSLWESEDSSGTVSLKALFEGTARVDAPSPLGLEKILFLLCRGGWPGAVNLGEKSSALRVVSDYFDSLVQEDVHRVDGVEKNPRRVELLLRSLARNVSTFATDESVMADVRGGDVSMTDKTFSVYMNALRRLFVVEDTPAWRPSIRSKTAMRASAKRGFVDPSIAVAALRTNPEGLKKDFQSVGFLFEALCARDLRIYASALDGDVLHYHDNSGLEADLIVRLRDGRWAAVEVKLGSREIDDAAKSLKTLAGKVNTRVAGEPSFLAVVTGTERAYRRNDGVYVIPLGCLKP